MNDLTSAKTIKERARKRVDGPSGNGYLVRRILLMDLTPIYGQLPDLESLAGDGTDIPREKAEAILKTRGPQIAAHFSKILTAGLVCPPIGTGPDEIEVADIPTEDQPVLVTAILELSGISKTEAARVRPTEGSGESSGLSTSSPSATVSGPLPSCEENPGS